MKQSKPIILSLCGIALCFTALSYFLAQQSNTEVVITHTAQPTTVTINSDITTALNETPEGRLLNEQHTNLIHSMLGTNTIINRTKK